MFKLAKSQKYKFGKVELYQFNGLQYLNIKNDSLNNQFNIGFRTGIQSSTGVAHVLEHIVLCGSHKYPVRDPFMKMLKKSFASYMNALTGMDITMYPFSTTNKKDYYNLMQVYLDAVFEPLLNEHSFKQECWRLSSEIKGVVYNEMKGAMADSNSIFFYENAKHLFKNSLYSYNSGGDPQHITSLTWQDMIKFHKERYHPSNSLVYSFGNMEVGKTMDMLFPYIENKEIMEPFKIPPVERWSQPQSVTFTGPFDNTLDRKQQNHVSISYLTMPAKEIIDSITMRLIADLMLDGASSPMYKALIDSNLGMEYSSTTGFGGSLADTYISFGVKGVADENIEKVKHRISECIQQVVKEGFSQNRINATFHQVEMSYKHRTAQFGLNLGFLAQSKFAQDIDIFESLDFENNLIKVRNLINQPGYIQSFVSKHILNNQHKLDLVMKPDPEYGIKLQKKESNMISQMLESLSESEMLKIEENERELEKLQDEKEDLSVLPYLTLADVPQKVAEYPVKKSTILSNTRKVDLTARETVTNGITYMKFRFNVSGIPDEFLPYLPMFSRCLTSLGTKNHPLDELDDSIRAIGSLSASCYCNSDLHDNMKVSTFVNISANCSDYSLDSVFDIVREILVNVNWKAEGLLWTALQSELSDLSSAVASNGHSFALKSSAAGLTPAAKQREIFNGLSQIAFLEGWKKEDMPILLEKLEEISRIILQSEMAAFVVAEEVSCKKFSSELDKLAEFLPPITNSGTMVARKPFERNLKPSSYNIDTSINFIGESMLGVPYFHKDGPALGLLMSLISTHFLHKEVREKGGAYGGDCFYSATNGLIQFMTYRDPLGYQRTLDTFEKARNWATTISENVTENDLMEAKLAILKNMDAPKDAAAEGLVTFQTGLLEADLQIYRDRVLATSMNDVENVALSILSKAEPVHCVVGEKLN